MLTHDVVLYTYVYDYEYLSHTMKQIELYEFAEKLSPEGLPAQRCY